MKAILISIRPKWVYKILNGEKTIEVRKGTTLYNAINRLIKEQGKAPCLIYCTKGKPYLWKFWFDGDEGCGYCYETSFAKDEYSPQDGETINGKVIAEFEASAEEIFSEGLENGCGGYNYSFYNEEIDDIREKSCLDEFELRGYLGEKRGGEVVGTAILIDNLEIFDKPKELKDFEHALHLCPIFPDNNFVLSFCRNHCEHNKDPERLDVYCDRIERIDEPLTKAPQSWCYVEVEE